MDLFKAFVGPVVNFLKDLKHEQRNQDRELFLFLIEKVIRIYYPYDFRLALDNSDFVTIWLEFDLLVRTIVQSKGFKR